MSTTKTEITRTTEVTFDTEQEFSTELSIDLGPWGVEETVTFSIIPSPDREGELDEPVWVELNESAYRQLRAALRADDE
jgi:hypothetical protein